MRGLQLPEPDRVVFERPPLVLAVFQVRFSNLPEVARQDYDIEPFRHAVKDEYPQFTRAKQAAVQIDPIAGELKQLESVQWRFTDERANWTVTLASDSLTLEARQYEHFEEFTF